MKCWGTVFLVTIMLTNGSVWPVWKWKSRRGLGGFVGGAETIAEVSQGYIYARKDGIDLKKLRKMFSYALCEQCTENTTTASADFGVFWRPEFQGLVLCLRGVVFLKGIWNFDFS